MAWFGVRMQAMCVDNKRAFKVQLQREKISVVKVFAVPAAIRAYVRFWPSQSRDRIELYNELSLRCQVCAVVLKCMALRQIKQLLEVARRGQSSRYRFNEPIRN